MNAGRPEVPPPGAWSRWLPVVAWASVIWLFSTDAFRGSSTGSVLTPLLEFLLPWADAGTIGALHALVRKLAHVTEYGILALLLFRAINTPQRSVARVAQWAWVLAAAYAASDEFHQSFVPSRTGALADVVLDSLGAALGVALAVWLTQRFSWGRRWPA